MNRIEEPVDVDLVQVVCIPHLSVEEIRLSAAVENGAVSAKNGSAACVPVFGPSVVAGGSVGRGHARHETFEVGYALYENESGRQQCRAWVSLVVVS